MSKIYFKNARKSDTKEIINLFSKIFSRKINKKIWIWRFEQSVFGKPIIRIAKEQNKIISNHISYPIHLCYKNKKINSLISMTHITLDSYSGKGIMTKLCNQAYEIGEKRHYRLNFAFLNSNSRYMFTQKLGFSELAVLKEVQINMLSQKLKTEYSCSKIDKFDDKFLRNIKIEKILSSKIFIKRNSKYLNWRFINNPEIKYSCYKINRENETIGYFVLKKYQNEKCHIVDFVINEDVNCYNAMINQSIEFCKVNNIDKLTLWINHKIPLYKYLKKIGITETSMDIYFVIKIFKNDLNLKKFLKFENWYITMSDSENF